MFERLILPKKSFEKIHTLSNDEKRLLITTKYVNDNKIGLTMTVNNGRLRQVINDLFPILQIMRDKNM